MDFSTLTIKEMAKLLAEKEISAKELTQNYLHEIDKAKDLNIFLSVAFDEAILQAEQIDKKRNENESLPILAGVPLVIKDNILIEGIGATSASRILEHYVAPYDATVISRLKEQGAIFLGKANMDEFAMGSSTENSAYGPVKNPIDNQRVPGGSSGGSAAAIAGNLCAGSLGSDTGGSIRQPASFCGVVGFKPTYGRVSRYGLMAMTSSFDQIGPFAKTAEDIAILFDVISGQDKMDATMVDYQPEQSAVNSLDKFDIKKLRIGVPKECFGEGLDNKVKASVQKAIDFFKSSGARIDEVSMPILDYALAIYYIIVPSEVSANLSRFDGIKYGLSEKDGDLLNTYLKSRQDGFGPEVKRRIMLGTYALSSGYYDAYYLRAQKVRTKICQEYKKVFDSVDVLITPTAPSVAFKFGEKTDNPLEMYLSDIYTVPINLAGLPAISVPCGNILPENGKIKMPVGMQIIGPQFKDELVISIANYYQKNI